MFTGIVTDIGRIRTVEPLDVGKRFIVETAYDVDTIDIGASIAHAGICLTVVDKGRDGDQNWYAVEAWEEALRLTTADNWQGGARLNLERAMRVGDEYGGHMVSGHVDAMAEIVSIKPEGDAKRIHLRAPDELAKYIAPKGSVTLDGTSLTVNGVEGSVFDVLLIRHTQEVTTWGSAIAGQKVNLEIDQIARYVERYVSRLAEAAKAS